jgi:hypothetical protein
MLLLWLALAFYWPVFIWADSMRLSMGSSSDKTCSDDENLAIDVVEHLLGSEPSLCVAA